MTVLEKYSNIYADLAQAAYTGRDKRKMLATLDNHQRQQFITNGYAEFNFGDGSQPVYLQKDASVKTIKEQRTIPFSTTETPQTYTYSYQKGLLTDEKAA